VDSSNTTNNSQVSLANKEDETEGCDPWMSFAYAVTCCVFPGCLKVCGKKNVETQRAWREKIVSIY
jgi:hypothetical protein